MKRVILAIPEGLSFEQLSPEQQAAINGVFGQFVNPMPGTQAANGKQIVDAVTADNFDPQAITDLGLPFELLAYQQWDGGELTHLVPLDEAAWLAYLPDMQTLNDEGNVVGTVPAQFHVPHQWAGWLA